MFAFFGILAVVLGGYLTANIFIPKRASIEKLALGFILGFGIFTFLLFLFNWQFNLAYSVKNSSLLLLLYNFILLGLNVFLPQLRIQLLPSFSDVKNEFKNLSKAELIVGVIIIFFFTSSLITNLYWPVRDWDSLVLYDFRAKTFLATGFMDDAISRGYFFGYPLYTSLVHTWLYLLNINYPVFWYSFIYFSFLILFYFSLRKSSKRFPSLLLTCLLATSPLIYGHAVMSYTNLPYISFLLPSFLYLCEFYNRGDKKLFILSGLLLGLSAWTRSAEPFWLIVVAVGFIIGLKRRALLSFIGFFAVFFIFYHAWGSFTQQYLTSAQSFFTTSTSMLGSLFANISFIRALEVSIYFWENIVKPYILYIGVIFLGMLHLFFIKKLREKLWLPLLFSFGALGLTFLGIYIFSVNFATWKEIGGSAERMALFFVPMAVYIAALMLSDNKVSKKT